MYTSDVDEFNEWGRRLLAALPDAFPETARRGPLTTDERERLQWVNELYERGELDLPRSLLCDM